MTKSPPHGDLFSRVLGFENAPSPPTPRVGHAPRPLKLHSAPPSRFTSPSLINQYIFDAKKCLPRENRLAVKRDGFQMVIKLDPSEMSGIKLIEVGLFLLVAKLHTSG